MTRKFLSVTIIGLIILLLWGCEKLPTDAEFSSDEEALRAMMLDNPQGYFSYDEHYGENDAKTEEGSKAERYTSWWRQPTDVDWVVSVDIVNDSAFVTFSPEVSGIFHLFVYDTIPPDTIIHYPKNIRDNVIRYAIFKHYSDSIGYRGWRLEKVSGVEITSNPHTVDIDSVRIECVSYPDTIITNPLTLFRRRNIFRFAPEEEVTLTVYSNDDIYAFLHARGRRFGFRRWWRWEFDEIEYGVWSGVWLTPQMPGVRMAAFDILHMNTLDDNEYQYDSDAWIFPYRVAPM